MDKTPWVRAKTRNTQIIYLFDVYVHIDFIIDLSEKHKEILVDYTIKHYCFFFFICMVKEFFLVIIITINFRLSMDDRYFMTL